MYTFSKCTSDDRFQSTTLSEHEKFFLIKQNSFFE